MEEGGNLRARDTSNECVKVSKVSGKRKRETLCRGLRVGNDFEGMEETTCW